MDVKTLKKIRQKESGSKSSLSELPANFYEDVQEALDYAFKSNDYDDFINIQIIFKNLCEIRLGKLLKFAVYRSTPKRMENADPVENILAEEQLLLNKFLEDIALFQDNLDVKLNGYFFQEVRR